MKVNMNQEQSNPFKLTLVSLFVSAALLASMSSNAQANGIKYDLAYPRTGDERAKPSQVFDDGRMTYIQMRKGLSSLIVFANTPSGQRKLNTRTTENCNVDCVVVEGLHDELIFVNEGFKSVAKYAGARQTTDKTAIYGAQAAAATYGAIGTNPIAPVAPPVAYVQPTPLVSNPATLTASLGNTLNTLASQFMTLASNAQGSVTGVAMSDSGSYLPTLDGTVINPPIKSGKQDSGSTAKEQDLIGLRLELKKLGANASIANDYSYAKALALLDLANETLRSKQGSGITEWLLHSAKAHMLAAKNKQLVSYRTVQLPGNQYTRQNQEQWRDITALHQLPGLRCSNSAALLAQASVQLLAAELKRGDNLTAEAEKHENSAKQLTQQAQSIVSRCTTQATTSSELPQFAPEVQLKLTKDTLASQSLFGFDSPKLTDKAIGFLNSFVEKIKKEFSNISVLEVIGYTDRLGSKAHNQKLSEKRADAVKNHLVTEFDQAGLKPTIVSARGEGAANPITKNCKGDKETKELVECLAPDRRVEISIKGDPRVDNYVPRSASAVNMPATVTPFNDSNAILLASSNPVSVIPAQPLVVAQNTVQGQMNSEQRLQLLDRQRQDLLNQIEAERQTAARESLLQKMMAEAQDAARRAYAAALEKMNLAQASKPVATAAASSAPGLQNYTVTLEDQNFRKVITKWARQSGWTFGANNWTPAVDIPVIAVDSVQTDFKSAVRRLLSSTELTDVALQPCFYANNVVRVVPIAEKCDRTQQ